MIDIDIPTNVPTIYHMLIKDAFCQLLNCPLNDQSVLRKVQETPKKIEETMIT